MTSVKQAALAATILAGMGPWTPACAQLADADATQGDADRAGNIVVTARKRVENVQDISATLNVLGADTLAKTNVRSLEQIESQIPGLQFGNTGFNGAQIGLRGISSQRAFTGDEAAVAVHIDGVFQPQSGQALARLFDVERVEVLKGPQGTLYGRNASAGVINVVTKGPGKDTDGYARLSYGSFNTVRAEGAATVLLGDDSGLRFAGIAAKGRGYIRNLSNVAGSPETLGNSNYYGGRIRYHGTFGNLRAAAGIQYVRDESRRDAAISSTDVGFYRAVIDGPSFTKRDDVNGFVQLDLDLGSVSLRSLSGVSYFDNNFLTDANVGLPVGNRLNNPGQNDGYSASEELTLLSKGNDKLDWRLGLYYQHTDLTERRNAIGNFPSGSFFYQDFRLKQKGDAYAGYGDATLRFAERFAFNLGLRYSYETKDASQNETHGEDAFGIGTGAPPPPTGALDCSVAYLGNPFPLPACNSQDSRGFSWKGLTGRAGLEFKPNDDALVYVNYSRGFRSGAVGGQIGTDNFFDAIFGGPGTFRLVRLGQETVDSYEAGFKSEFFDRQLTINAAAFYSSFKNMLFTIADPQTFRFVEGNLGKARVRGIDLTVVARPLPRLALTFNGELLDSKVIDAPPADFFFGVPAISLGNDLPRAPRFSASTSADYTLPVGSAGNLNLFAQLDYKSRHYFDLSNTTQQERYALVNLSARFTSNAGWYLFANGNNITGTRYLVSGGAPIDNPGRISIRRPGPPATFEAGAGIRF